MESIASGVKVELKHSISIIPYKSEIKYIYHISDIHIHLYKRHNEYELVFARVLEYLQSERKVNKIKSNSKRDISMICVITGDILHSKSDLSPECIALTYKFLKNLLDILPVVVIPGNHDLNMNNKERLDSLTPIICDLPDHYPIHYLNKTGCWLMGNVLFSHASIFDYYIIPPDWIDNELLKIRNLVSDTKDPLPANIYKIVLYHGRVNGAELYNGLGIEGEQDTIMKRKITINSFDGYDFALLGDIHKHQFLDKKCHTRGYAGSLIQQNLGEDLAGHGLVKWTLGNLIVPSVPNEQGKSSNNQNNRCGKFVPIANDTGYMTFKLNAGQNNYDKLEAILSETTGVKIPKNLHVRILYVNTIQSQVHSFVEWLGTKHNVLEYSCQNDEPSGVSGNTGNSLVSEGELLKRSEFDINNVEYQNQLLEEIIIANYSAKLMDGDMAVIKALNRDANKLFNDPSEEEIDRRITLPGQRFKLMSIEFDNLFSYGEGNVINFNNCKGVVGIIASNHMGKSAILDIILYGLFDKFTREGNIKDMINNRKTSYRVKLVVQSGIWRYTIFKSGKKTHTGGSKNECTFTRLNISTGREENLAKDTAKRTREYICEVFGNFEDMINTNFSIQTNSTGFIDASNSARRSELEKILRFDFLTELAKQAGKQYNDAKSIYEHLQKTMPAERINLMVSTITENEVKLLDAGVQYDKLIVELGMRNAQINELHKQLNPDADLRLDNLLTDVDMSKDVLMHSSANDSLNNCENMTQTATKTATKTAILSQVELLEAQKVQYKNELNVKYQLIISAVSSLPQLGELVNESDVLANGLIMTDEERMSSKSIKKWRETIKDVLQRRLLRIRVIKSELEELIKSVGVKISDKRNMLQRYVVGKVGWDKLQFDVANVALQQKIGCLTVSNDELAIKAIELDKQREKSDKYRRQIEELRGDLDILQSCEQIPDFLKNEIVADGVDVEKLMQQVLEWEQMSSDDFKARYNDMKPVLLKSGWLVELGTRVKANVKADAKSVKLRGKIDEYKIKLEKVDKNIKSLSKDITNGQKIQNEYQKLMRESEFLGQDILAYVSNEIILGEIGELEKMELEYRKNVLNKEMESKVDEIKEMLLEYEELDVNYKNSKSKLKTLGGIQVEMDELIILVERNNSINQKIMLELGDVKDLTLRVNVLNNQMERYKDTISGLRGQLEKMREDCQVKIQKEKLMNIYCIYRDALKLVPIVLISKVQPVIERKVNDLLSTITDFSVKFSMEDNKIDIYLDRAVYAGEPILINNSSGFERFISSLAIRIALLEISQLPSPNFIAIDEGWSCFDNENIANMELILGHLGQKFDFILTISHLQVIRQHCDIQITLRRSDDGFSVVNYQ